MLLLLAVVAVVLRSQTMAVDALIIVDVVAVVDKIAVVAGIK